MFLARKRLLIATSVLALSAATSTGLVANAAEPTEESAAERILGVPRSGLAWHSGVWPGGRFDTETLKGFGSWRGRPADVVTAYTPYDSYESMMQEDWSIRVWNGFAGKINYAVAPLPDSGEGSFESIIA